MRLSFLFWCSPWLRPGMGPHRSSQFYSKNDALFLDKCGKIIDFEWFWPLFSCDINHTSRLPIQGLSVSLPKGTPLKFDHLSQVHLEGEKYGDWPCRPWISMVVAGKISETEFFVPAMENVCKTPVASLIVWSFRNLNCFIPASKCVITPVIGRSSRVNGYE